MINQISYTNNQKSWQIGGCVKASYLKDCRSHSILCISFCLIVFLLFSFVHAEEEKDDSMIVNSGEAQYDGKEIVLVGDVAVQHSLGQIFAHRLSVLPSTAKDKKLKFGFFKISDDVHINLKEGGELYCQQAEIDYAKMQGIFLGNLENSDVIYLNPGDQKSKAPLELKSQRMLLKLFKESAKTFIKEIEADQNVRVRYNQDYLLLADRAVYQRLPVTEASIAGLLTLTVQGNLPACKMTNLNGDRLSAQMIRVNTIERWLSLNQPTGILYLRQAQPIQILEFSADELIWDDQQQNLLFKGNVKITQNDALQVLTDQEISISQAIINGKRELKVLCSPENTHISYLDVQKRNTHRIYCPGAFIIDHEHQEMTLHGLLGRENQQVYIEDDLGEMYADKIYLNYSWGEKQLVPEKMVLEGHVRLMNRFDGHLEESGSILHYALADRVEYFPKQQEMFLTSTDGNRVLFFDKVNNVQMSAPSLKVRQDFTTKKEAIQGLGDVRFTFIENEFEQLKRYFPLLDTSEKEQKSAKSNKK